MMNSIKYFQKKKFLIIPIFLNSNNCLNQCIFCYKDILLNFNEQITFDFILKQILKIKKEKKHIFYKVITQIAFYGSNFTGIPQEKQQKLLLIANKFVQNGLINSIRISTRPDYINQKKIDFLKKMHVSTVEIGAESLNNYVLCINNRGHTVFDIYNAIKLLKLNNLQVVMHLMVGLPGDNTFNFFKTVKQTIKLSPDMVRIHPTIIFNGTQLANIFNKKNYKPLKLNQAIMICKIAVIMFHIANIPVIRIGLQATPEMQKKGIILAGPFHPSFGLIVRSKIFLEIIQSILEKEIYNCIVEDKFETIINCSYFDESSIRGLKNFNFIFLKKKFELINFKIKSNKQEQIGKFQIIINSKILNISIKNFYKTKFKNFYK